MVVRIVVMLMGKKKLVNVILKDASVDCEGSWGEWGECDATCGWKKNERLFSNYTSSQWWSRLSI